MPFGPDHDEKNYLTKLYQYEKLIDFENSLSSVEDVAKVAVFFATRKPATGVYNVCNPGSKTTKQISNMLDIHKQWFTEEEFKKSCKQAYISYEKMLDAGVAREVARGVLPVTIYSSAYVTMNSRALMNFLSLRLKADGSHFPSYPQREIEMVAEKYEDFFAKIMPITHQAFIKNGRVAP